MAWLVATCPLGRALFAPPASFCRLSPHGPADAFAGAGVLSGTARRSHLASSFLSKIKKKKKKIKTKSKISPSKWCLRFLQSCSEATSFPAQDIFPKPPTGFLSPGQGSDRRPAYPHTGISKRLVCFSGFAPPLSVKLLLWFVRFSTAVYSCLTVVQSRFKSSAGRIKVKVTWMGS